MKEIQVMESVKICEDEIEVKPYLTYAEIQSICDAVCKFDSWSEREQNKDILLLHFATNFSDQEIEEIGHDAFVQSGMMDVVKSCVKNYNKIDEAVNYTQSTQRGIAQILDQLPKILKKVENRAGKPSKK